MGVRGDGVAAAGGAAAADPSTSCFQGAELRANVDRLVVVADQEANDGAGRASTAPRSSWLESQETTQTDGSSAQVASVAWLAPGELWADVDRVGPDQWCHGWVDAAGRTGLVDVCTVEDVAQEVGVTAADVRSAAAETLDAVSGVVAVAGSGADVGRSRLGSLMGTSSQVVGVRGDSVAAVRGAVAADPSTSYFQGAELWADVDRSGPGLCADGEAVAGSDGQVQANGVRETDEDAADEASRAAQYLGCAPCVAQRVPWANVAQMEGPTGGGGDMALQKVSTGTCRQPMVRQPATMLTVAQAVFWGQSSDLMWTSQWR